MTYPQMVLVKEILGQNYHDIVSDSYDKRDTRQNYHDFASYCFS